MKLLILDILANGSVWTGVITAWQNDLDYWTKIIASFSAIVLAWVTIYIRVRDKNKDKDSK